MGTSATPACIEPAHFNILAEVCLLQEKHPDLRVSPQHLEWLASAPESEAQRELAELRSMCRMTPFVLKD